MPPFLEGKIKATVQIFLGKMRESGAKHRSMRASKWNLDSDCGFGTMPYMALLLRAHFRELLRVPHGVASVHQRPSEIREVKPEDMCA